MTSYITDEAYIDGLWCQTEKTFDVKNPFSGKVIGKAADCDEDQTRLAIEIAKKAFPSWRFQSARDRSAIFRKWTDLIRTEKQAIGELITLENGKPLAQSISEAAYAANFIEWCSEEGRRTYGSLIPSPHPAKRMMTIKLPIGVAAMITPWNYPAAMVARNACAALAAGCTVVLKPSEEAPFSALALARLGEKAGLPPGVFNVIPTSRYNVNKVVKLLCTHADVSAVSFTGSTATGKVVLQHAASTVKKVCLELGGLAPLIVFDSCDLKKAVKGTMASKFRYSGQTCVCPNRILVQSGIHDKFVAELEKSMTNELVLGDGMNPNTTIGPLINEAGLERVSDQVQDALSKGCKLICGGKTVGRNMFEPTLITRVKTNMKCFTNETFGPLLPIYKFNTEDEALNIANDTKSGLASYVFSGDVGQCWRVAEKLETGIVGINECSFSFPEAPFGGFKESGLGREGSHYALAEYMEVKYMCWGI